MSDIHIVMIHPGPSDECACPLCHPDDGMCHDDHDRQGRSPEQVAANAKATPWIWLAGAVLAVVIALCAAVTR